MAEAPSPVIEVGDPDVAKFKTAARALKTRGVRLATAVGYVQDVYRPPNPVGLHLPANFRATHQTAGLPGFPAIDLFANPGTPVFPPEVGELIWPHFIEWDEQKRVGGWTGYYQGASGNTYFFTHFAALIKPGPCNMSTVIGSVAKVPHGAWQPHIHHARHKGRYNPPL